MAYANREVICTNQNGTTVTFTERAFTPFLLCKIEGVYEVTNNVTISENTMNDGGTYQGSVAKKRNIVITFKDEENHAYNRNLLYALFQSKTKGKLTFKEDENVRAIDYYVEKLSSDGLPKHRTYVVSLLCPDPYFYEPSDEYVSMSAWLGAFEFPHQFRETKEEIGYRSSVRIQDIENQIAADGIGVTITLTANGNVTNPSITRIESDESIKIGSESYPFTMHSNDELKITTMDNDKHIYLISGGVENEINQYLTEDSVFFQLMRGHNSIGYDADEGADALTVTISYRFKYEGA